MGDLIQIIEGPVKYRDGKKWKNRFACVTRLSPVADSLTLQLWKDKRDWERNPPSKGSLSLQEYLGWEAGFTLDKESHTLALILKDEVIIFALENRENLMRWQVRVTSQFEEGQHFIAHLIQVPSKSKLAQGPVKIHVQNRRFSMTTGVPPRLVHSWNLADLRRFGGLENGRFCFEGGSRCGKGEGIHLLRLDVPEDLQVAFESATKGKLESKRKSVYKTLPLSPSLSSHLDGMGVSAAQSVLSVATTCNGRSYNDRHMSGAASDLSSTDSMATLLNSGQSLRGSRDDLLRQRSASRSRCGNPSINWSIKDGSSSIDTMSIALSELTEASFLQSNNGFHNQMIIPSSNPSQPHSPEHLVNRKDLLERMGLSTANGSRHSRSQPGSRSITGTGEFAPQWSMDLGSANSSARGSFRGQSSRSIDRISISSHESQASGGGMSESSGSMSNYDTPKAAVPCSSNGQHSRISWSVNSQGSSNNSFGTKSPPPTPKSQRSSVVSRNQSEDDSSVRQFYASIPCKCPPPKQQSKNAFENYDVPRSLCKQDALLNYDTPRNLKESLDLSDNFHSQANFKPSMINPMGNYDVPHLGSQPIPVFKKTCGCIMKLNQSQKGDEPDGASWSCIGSEATDLKVPRVKLTGTGKMPVADMRTINNANNLNNCSLDTDLHPPLQPTHCLEPNVKGLPPKSPVYAVINKLTKKKSQPTSPTTEIPEQQQQSLQPFQLPVDEPQAHEKQTTVQPLGGNQYHNYCNIAPLLGDVIKQSAEAIQIYANIQPDHTSNGDDRQVANRQAFCTNGNNYAEMDGDLQTNGHYYENSSAVLSRLREEELLSSSSAPSGDYLPMDPNSFQVEMPLRPFESFNLSAVKSGEILPPPQYEPIDPISQKLIEFQDALDTEETSFASLESRTLLSTRGQTRVTCYTKNNQEGLFNLCDLGQAMQLDGLVDFSPIFDNSSQKSSSMEILAATGWLCENDGAYDTIRPSHAQSLSKSVDAGSNTKPGQVLNPTENGASGGSVTMRRSSSVPGKPVSDRGSTSSSDSGFSPGSPNQVINTSTSLNQLLGT